ncbi:MAG: pyridoxal 5'-phosphate synthase glutaminase subunit PdxT [Sphaerochaeta sp.]
MKVGVLALHGGFAEHVHASTRLGVSSLEIRRKQDLERSFDALILPGGESTVMARLLGELGLFSPLREMLEGGLPVWGTCAGMILLAQELEGEEPSHFSFMPITVQRNAFGRQLGSFHKEGIFTGIGSVPMTFIRAPHIARSEKNVHILATHNGYGVAAKYARMLVTAFHPELTGDDRVLQYFLEMAALTE